MPFDLNYFAGVNLKSLQHDNIKRAHSNKQKKFKCKFIKNEI